MGKRAEGAAALSLALWPWGSIPSPAAHTGPTCLPRRASPLQGRRSSGTPLPTAPGWTTASAPPVGAALQVAGAVDAPPGRALCMRFACSRRQPRQVGSGPLLLTGKRRRARWVAGQRWGSALPPGRAQGGLPGSSVCGGAGVLHPRGLEHSVYISPSPSQALLALPSQTPKGLQTPRVQKSRSSWSKRSGSPPTW